MSMRESLYVDPFFKILSLGHSVHIVSRLHNLELNLVVVNPIWLEYHKEELVPDQDLQRYGAFGLVQATLQDVIKYDL